MNKNSKNSRKPSPGSGTRNNSCDCFRFFYCKKWFVCFRFVLQVKRFSFIMKELKKELKDKFMKKWPDHLLPLKDALSSRKFLYRLGSSFNVVAVGCLSKVLVKMNNFKVYNHDIFLKVANNNYLKKERPLITISNHHSCLDDPVLWGALLPWSWQIIPGRHRWTAAAEDICFTKPLHTLYFALGQTFPIERGKGICQPAIEFATQLILQKKLLHVFPQGKVCDEPDVYNTQLVEKNNHKMLVLSDRNDVQKTYSFKWGLAKLIIDSLEKRKSSFDSIEILPFYHLGMDKVLPSVRPYIPRFMKKVTIYIRKEGPIIFDNDRLDWIFTNFSPSNTIEGKRISICRFLEEEMKKLKLETMKRHFEVKNCI